MKDQVVKGLGSATDKAAKTQAASSSTDWDKFVALQTTTKPQGLLMQFLDHDGTLRNFYVPAFRNDA